MTRYSVHVKTEQKRIAYIAYGVSSADVADAAIDKFGICSVFVEAV